MVWIVVNNKKKEKKVINLEIQCINVFCFFFKKKGVTLGLLHTVCIVCISEKKSLHVKAQVLNEH